MATKHVIIGCSAAGIAVINTLRRLDAQAEIICIADEHELPYNKCHLADYVSGIKTQEEVYTFSLTLAQQKNITLLLGRRVVQILPQDCWSSFR